MDEHSADRLAELLMETGRQHHSAFSDSDGDDPEWPLWYAEYLAGRIDEHMNATPTRSQIVQWLMNAADAHAVDDSDEAWPSFYAMFILGPGDPGLHAVNSSA